MEFEIIARDLTSLACGYALGNLLPSKRILNKVWPDSEIRDFWNNLFWGYPVGNLVFHRVHGKEEVSVIDGKSRLEALAQGMYPKAVDSLNRCSYYFDVWAWSTVSLPERDANQAPKHFLPLDLFPSRTALRAWVWRLSETTEPSEDLEELFTRLLDNYVIPIYLYTTRDTTPEITTTFLEMRQCLGWSNFFPRPLLEVGDQVTTTHPDLPIWRDWGTISEIRYPSEGSPLCLVKPSKEGSYKSTFLIEASKLRRKRC